MNEKVKEIAMRDVRESARLARAAARESEAARSRRDELISRARRLGISLREIGEAAGLDHTMIAKIERGATR